MRIYLILSQRWDCQQGNPLTYSSIFAGESRKNLLNSLRESGNPISDGSGLSSCIGQSESDFILWGWIHLNARDMKVVTRNDDYTRGCEFFEEFIRVERDVAMRKSDEDEHSSIRHLIRIQRSIWGGERKHNRIETSVNCTAHNVSLTKIVCLDLEKDLWDETSITTKWPLEDESEADLLPTESQCR